MIVVDIETSGLTPDEGIWQIGAIDLANPSRVFLGEARIDDDDLIDPGALKVTGKTEEDLRDKTKQSQKEMIEHYLDFVEATPERIFLGHNVGWDVTMIQSKCIRFGLFERFSNVHKQRSLDLYTVAQLKHLALHKHLALKGGKGAFSLAHVMEFCGLSDTRIHITDYNAEVIKEGEAHDALSDCKFEAECFFRLTEGRNFFDEFKHFAVPAYLKQ